MTMTKATVVRFDADDVKALAWVKKNLGLCDVFKVVDGSYVAIFGCAPQFDVFCKEIDVSFA